MAQADQSHNTPFVFFHLAARLTPPPGLVRAPGAGDTASAAMRNARRMADALDEARRAA